MGRPVVYYVVGLTAMGKTTSSIKLASALGLPCLHADTVYEIVKKKLGAPCDAAKLTEPLLWSDPKNFGIQNWGEFQTMHDVKREGYKELLSGLYGEAFVIEGFTLSFKDERDLVVQAVGEHIPIVVRINMSFDNWIEFFKAKFGRDASGYREAYKYFTNCFQSTSEDTVITFAMPEEITVPHLLNKLVLCFKNCNEI